MTIHQVVIEEAQKRGVPEELVRAALQRAAVNVGPDERDRKELAAEEVEKARKAIGDLMDMIRQMTPAQRILCRSILVARARANSIRN